MAGNMAAMVKPISPRRIDWASLQSSSRQSSGDYELPPRSDLQTPPPRDPAPSPASGVHSRMAQIRFQQRQSTDKVYDLPTLMKYRGSLAGLTVFAKIKPEALAENLFQYIGRNQPQRTMTRTRGLSELSNRSLRSEQILNLKASDLPQVANGTSLRSGQPGPENQPFKRDGFVRFLKQHASPPHHRVTAGGRIVPAGPYSPPPMFDYESLTGMIDQRRQRMQNVVPPVQTASFYERNRGPNWPPPYTTSIKGSMQHMPGSQSHLSGIPNVQGQLPPLAAQSLPQNVNLTTANLHMPLLPISSFDDGSILATCNGMYFRAYWNGMGTTIEPLPFVPGQPAAASHTEVAAPVAQSENPARPALPTQPVIPKPPTTNGANKFRSSDSQESRSAPMFDAQERRLKASLSELDRQMALHHYELSYDQRASCVSKRRGLIEEIDSIRRVREASTSDAPLLDFKDLMKGASARNGQSTSAKNGILESQARTGPKIRLSSSQPRKALSPNAPPFVPNRLEQGVRTVSGQISAIASRSSSVQTGLQSNLVATSSHDAQAGHKAEDSLDRDPDDPAMRVIHNSDITYAAKYEVKGGSEVKRYCTKVSEFQEALRRVREQARLYGCAGGSSKDPAYDAEQDIWWAICDHDPIPLPSNIPEHVQKPQPWDWNRSMFNYRANITHLSTQDVTAAATPQLKDKAMLEKATDTNDATLPMKIIVEAPKDSDLEQKLSDANAGKKITIHEDLSSPSGVDSATIDAIGGVPAGSITPENTKVKSKVKTKSFSESDTHAVASKEMRTPLATSSGNRQKLANAKAFETSGPPHNKSSRQPAETVQQPVLPAESSAKAIKKDPLQRKNQDSSEDSFKSAAESMPTDSEHKLKPQRSNANLSVRSKAPQRVKSKQNLRHQTSGRRHRQNFKQGELAKQKSLVTVHGSSPSKDQSESSAKPHQDEMSDKSRRSLFSMASQQLSPRSAARKAKRFYDRSRPKSPLKRRQSGSQLKDMQPRVNLPALAKTHLQDKPNPAPRIPDETKSIAVSSPTKGPPKDSFLREMIMHARFLSNQTVGKKNSPTKLDTTHKIQGLGEPARSEMNKENAPADSSSSKARDSTTNSEDSSLDVSYGRITGKTTSSLAASSFHANAFLPQFDGAGKAQTASIQKQHGPKIPPRQARVSLPTGSSYSDLVQSRRTNDTSFDSNSAPSKQQRSSRSSAIFGLDGSGDEPPKQRNSPAKPSAAGKGKEVKFDTRGLTEADFDPKGKDVKNEEHYKEVDEFFEKLAADEKERIARRLAGNRKSA